MADEVEVEEKPERIITLKELREHNSVENGLWIAIDGVVYDVTKYSYWHPGGENVLKEVGGTDASKAYANVDHTEAAVESKERHRIGVLPEFLEKQGNKGETPVIANDVST